MGPAGLETKNVCADRGQQQIIRPVQNINCEDGNLNVCRNFGKIATFYGAHFLRAKNHFLIIE
jgi:hypothetical protein